MSTKGLSACLKLLNQAQSLLIVTHTAPDGDAIGSSLALVSAGHQKGKAMAVICADEIPPIFQFIPNWELIKQAGPKDPWDMMVTVDCGDLRRTGFEALVTRYGQLKRLVNIDHHPKNDLQKLATVHYGSEHISSTAELIGDLVQAWAVEITQPMSTCLLTGLYTDTGGFRHANTSPKTLKLVAHLLERGARLNKITGRLVNNKPVPALKLWGRILRRIKVSSRWPLTSSVITARDLTDCQASLDDLSGAVNLMNTTNGASVAILVTETPEGMIKGSLRTEGGRFDVGQLAALFGGGGHRKASGFTMPGRLIFHNQRWRVELE